MLILVDGYNVTRRDPATRALSLEEQRDALVARLRSRGREMLGPGSVLVVFDARHGDARGGLAASGSPPAVVYARERSADDEIVARARVSAQKVVLVSDDRELADRVRAVCAHGVELRSAAACYDGAGRGAARKGRRPSPPRDVGLPPGANKVTEELKRLWGVEE